MTADEWLQEAMRQINALTPDVAGKAFNPDWFLLRNHLEDGVRVLLSDAISAEREACKRDCIAVIEKRRSEGLTGFNAIHDCLDAISKRPNVI